MAEFAEEYYDEQIVQKVLAQITWCQNSALMDKLKGRSAEYSDEEFVQRVVAQIAWVQYCYS